MIAGYALIPAFLNQKENKPDTLNPHHKTTDEDFYLLVKRDGQYNEIRKT